MYITRVRFISLAGILSMAMLAVLLSLVGYTPAYATGQDGARQQKGLNPKLILEKGYDAGTLDRTPSIQSQVYLTDPDLDIWIDDGGDCICVVDIDGDGSPDAFWEANGQGRVRPDRGQVEGQGLLGMDDADIVFTFTEIERTIRDEIGDPFGIVLGGEATVADGGGVEEFRFTAAVTFTVRAPERLNWDIRGSDLSLQFEAPGTLHFE